MIFVCYVIMFVNLFHPFDQAENFTYFNKYQERNQETSVFLKSINFVNKDEYLIQIMTPYWNLTYDEQLDLKQNRSRKIVDMIERRCETFNDTHPCKLLKIVPSRVTKGYRSMDVFNIRYGIDGNPKTVGIIVGKHSLGQGISFHATKISTMKESHKRIAQVYENFIRLSPLRPCLSLNDEGHWRKITLRSNAADEILASVTVQPRGFPKEIILEQQEKLKEYFMKHVPNITLYYQKCILQRCTHSMSPFVLLYGNPYLIENINGYKFKITPETYIPINKFGAELLYDTAIKMAKLKRSSTVVDIYSGSGMMSIIASKFVREVIGVNYVNNADIEAIWNAKNNNLKNTKFLLIRKQDSMEPLFARLQEASDIVVIANGIESRPGFEFIKIIRRNRLISKLLYVTNKAESSNAIENFISLSSYNELNTPPFRLTKAIPIDVLPQTYHVELILLFER